MFVSRSYTAYNEKDYKKILSCFKEDNATYFETVGKYDYFKTYIGIIYAIYKKY